MANVINLVTQYKPKVAERFIHKSYTDAYTSHDYEFVGEKGIRVFSIDSVPTVDYTRSGTARFGDITELGDTLQEYIIDMDRAFSFSIDKGNSIEQLNIKQCSARMKANWDEIVVPEIDKYRIKKWIAGAGTVTTATAALTKTTVIEAIMTAKAVMSNLGVPTENLTVFMGALAAVQLKLADQVVGIDTLGAKSIGKGVAGEIDGATVVLVPDNYLPTGVNFMIKYKSATIDPMTLKTMRVQKDPIGIDGDVAEVRYIYDCFVQGNKENGILVHALTANAVVAPTITLDTTDKDATLASTTTDATIYYTTDGSSPKTGKSRAVYSSAVDLEVGQTIKCYAEKSGLISSGVISATL